MSSWERFSPGIRKVLRHVKRTKGWYLIWDGIRRKPMMCPLRSMTKAPYYELEGE